MALDQDVANLPPQLQLYYLATGHYVSQAVYVAAKLGVADALAGGPRSAEEIARDLGAHAPSLRRLLRLLVSAGVFAETNDGKFALASVGECLRSDLPGSFRSAALLFTGPHLWASWGGLLHTVRTGEMAALHVHGEDPFAYFEKHPEEGRVFDEAMAAFTSMVALGVAAAYDFPGITTLVDVGGGNGALLIGILRSHAQLRGVVFDLPRVGDAARRQIEAAGLAARCQVVSGDFFKEVPSGGDAYMLKHVIHDWNDEQATAILRSCHRAMKPNGKLLIVEGVYPPRIDRSIEGVGAARNDVNMMVVTGGRQRSEAEFRALYRATGFELTRIVPTMGGTCVIEGERR